MYVVQAADSMVGTDSSEVTQAEDSRVTTDSAKGTQRKRVMTDSAEVIARSPSFPRISPIQKVSS